MRLFASCLAAAGVLGVVALAPTVAEAGVRYNDYYDQGDSGFGVYVETPSEQIFMVTAGQTPA
jgi:hypothetical protein